MALALGGLVVAWLHVATHAVQTQRRRSVKSKGGIWQMDLVHDDTPDPWDRDWSNLRKKIKCLTADSNTSEHLVPMSGAPGIMCENPAANKSWTGGNKLKVLFFLEWLKKQDPETLVIAVDRDMTYGGCDLDVLVKDFVRITAKAKKKVVAGAEFGLFPNSDQHTRDAYEKLNWQLHAGHAAFGTHADNFTRFGRCPSFGAPCSDPPQYKYVNSGFYMAQAKDLNKTLLDVLRVPSGGDQDSLTRVYLTGSNSSLTLDFTGSLVMDMYGLDANDGLEWTHGTFYNAVTTRQMCFGHWNGNSRPFMKVYLAMLNKSNASHGCRQCWHKDHCPQDSLCVGSPADAGL